MNEPCLVEWCDRPVVEGHFCMVCSDKLSRALGDVPALWDELDTVLTKQARYAAAEFRRGEQALPFNPVASEIGWVLRNTLSTWCRIIGEERGRELPEDTPAAMARWLLNHVSWLRHHLAGAEAVEEITSAVRAVRKAVDRPAERIYAGPCKDCNGDMYGKPGAAMVACRPCGLEYDVAEMVAWMRQEARGRLVTAREGAVLLSKFGFETTRNRIDLWHHKKLIEVSGHDPQGRNLFRVDDLIDKATELAATPVRRVS